VPEQGEQVELEAVGGARATGAVPVTQARR
jgi:hypothetical protein